ncbi:MAG: arylsulfatase [Pirellulales bacterium]
MLALLSRPAYSQAKQPAAPNIVIILTDDMGYSDLGCYGGEINTPNLDSLADNGLRFTQFYNTGRCCPTRASLLTGLYPHQAGVGHMMEDRQLPGYRGDLNGNCVTIAEVLRTAGYGTYMCGKWHVTPAPKRGHEPDRHNWPLQRGFDHFYGTIMGGGSYFDPATLTRDNKLIVPENFDEYYYTDAITGNAVGFIEQRDAERPFFLYVAYTAAHWPMHAKPEDIAKYQGKYDAGWDALRQQRYERMQQLGVIDSTAQLSPNVQDWDAVQDKAWYADRMEVYAAMVDSMDQGVGRIVNALQNQGQLDNTLVLYLQDNGGCQEEIQSLREPTTEAALRPKAKPLGPRAMQFDLTPAFARDGRPVRLGRGVVPGPADTYGSYGIEWANVSNTPFRQYKHFVHEGGISTPLIAHWPAQIERTGELEHQPGHLIDLMATCVDLAGAEYPAQRGDQAVSPREGVTLRPAFAGQPLERERPIFWEHESNRAVRAGDWKLVAKGKSGPWELYEISTDRSEMNDLAATHPEKVAELTAAWDAWAQRSQVLPLFGK